MKTVDFLPGEGSLSDRAEMEEKTVNYDLSMSDRGPELGSLSLGIVSGREKESVYEFNVLLVFHT